MVKLITLNLFTLLTLCLLLASCGDKETLIHVELINDDNTEIIFSPEKGNWYKLNPPDSFVVNITGGFPPFIISERPLLNTAFIKNNQLIIYPSPLHLIDKGQDYINVEDNFGNIKTFNIQPYDSLIRYYNIESLNLNIYGDTIITRNNFELYSLAGWNPATKSIFFTAVQDSLSLTIIVLNVSGTGVYPLKNDDRVVYPDYRFSQHYINPFYPKGSNINVEVTELSNTALKGNFVIDATSTATFNNPNQYNVKINCTFSFSR